MLNDYSNVIKVVSTCFRQVKSSERSIGIGGLNPGNTLLIRCLYLLGLFAQYAKIDEHREQFNPALGLAMNVSVTSLIAKLIAAFTQSSVPEALRKVAITSYGILLLGQSDNRFLVSWQYRLFQIGNGGCSADYHIFIARRIASVKEDYFGDFS
jgi:hypothetical protein